MPLCADVSASSPHGPILTRPAKGGRSIAELRVYLLIAIVLVAVGVPTVSRLTTAVQDTVSESTVRAAAAAMEACYLDTQDYGACTATTLRANGTPRSVSLGYRDETEYVVIAASKSGTRFWMHHVNGGGNTYGCRPAGGKCPSTGRWAN